MSVELTDEEVRILRAAAAGRMLTNEHHRWIIEGDKRPQRAARERLKRLKLIEWELSPLRGGPTFLVATDAGRQVLTDRAHGGDA